jgi:replicative DNA helicase Mcm
MADKGLIAVDELDKTDKESRGALHEALEQQQVSYSKAGKTGQFRARCSLLAAANPSEGRFDEYDSVVSQVDLEPPLISRFDLIFTVTDEADEESDRELAEHILDSIREAQTGEYDVTEPEYDTGFLRKYISYARRKIEPSLTDEAYRELAEWYVDFRNSTDSETDTIPATARQLEAAERLAEASARTRLSDEVTKKDVDNAIGLLMSSLLRVGRDPETGNFDADILESGISQSQRERKRTFEQIVRELTENGSAPIDDIIEACEDEGIMSEQDVYDEIDDRKRRGDMMEPAQDEVRLIE